MKFYGGFREFLQRRGERNRYAEAGRTAEEEPINSVARFAGCDVSFPRTPGVNRGHPCAPASRAAWREIEKDRNYEESA